MSHFTIFACPKDNTGPVALAQRNAVYNWITLGAEVLLFGNGSNLDGLAALGARILPPVNTNQYGTPLVNEIFQRGQAEASYPVVCYANTDIAFSSQIQTLVSRIGWNPELSRFLIVGQRHDRTITQDFLKTGVNDEVIAGLAREATLHQPAGIDYFIFNRPWPANDWPPFALGRFRWDNWLIWRALKDHRRVIDATMCLTALHHDHDYAHAVLGDKTATYNGPECSENTRLARESGCDRWCTILDAPYAVDSNYRFTMR